ncbi:MAG: hypothetical protein J7J91_12210 [Deltaproteobacteria bacterium]|nr:hypothetical protein [Deltaproteobacteria bacterium]
MKVLGECSTEEALIEALGFKAHHISGKSRLINKLERMTNTVGIVDRDPGSPSPSRMKQFKEHEEFSRREHGYIVLYDPKRNNWLIVLDPRFEGWIINVAKTEGISLRDYFMPEDPDRLHKVLSTDTKKEKLRRLLNDLKDSATMQSLKETLERIINNLQQS